MKTKTLLYKTYDNLLEQGQVITAHQVDMVYLSKPELEKIRNQKFEKPVLTVNRDIFVFACFTGLLYADVKVLNKNNLQVGVDSKKWIYMRRNKTNT